MQDGIGQVGAGQSDMRIAGEDLQHNRQKRTGNRAPHNTPVSQIEVHEAIMNEKRAHGEGKQQRISDLQRHLR